MEDKTDYKLYRFDELPEGVSEGFKKMAEEIYALLVSPSKTYASGLITNAVLIALANFLAQILPDNVSPEEAGTALGETITRNIKVALRNRKT